MKCILGKKVGMTQVFLPSGEVIPVTKIKAGPCQITQILSKEKPSIQIGFDGVKESRLTKPLAGHLKGLRSVRILREFNVDKVDGLNRGDEISLETFSVGEKVSVIGTSKGRGFAGVVKRHHFGGGPASHGHKDNLRAPGSIGAGGVQRVFKGMRMAGHMGDAQVTVKNLEIVNIDLENNEILIKGALPGGRNALVVVCGKGDMKIKTPEIKEEVKEAVEAQETPVQEVPEIKEEKKESDAEVAVEEKVEKATESVEPTTEEKVEDNA